MKFAILMISLAFAWLVAFAVCLWLLGVALASGKPIYMALAAGLFIAVWLSTALTDKLYRPSKGNPHD